MLERMTTAHGHMDVSLLRWSGLATARVLHEWQFKVKSTTAYLALTLHTLERVFFFFYPSLLFFPSFLPSLIIIIVNVFTIKRMGVQLKKELFSFFLKIRKINGLCRTKDIHS